MLVPLDELADVQSLEELEAAPHALAGLLLVQPAQDPDQLLSCEIFSDERGSQHLYIGTIHDAPLWISVQEVLTVLLSDS